MRSWVWAKKSKKNISHLLMGRIFLLRDLLFRGGVNRRQRHPSFHPYREPPRPGSCPRTTSVVTGIATYGALPTLCQAGGRHLVFLPIGVPICLTDGRIMLFFFPSSERAKEAEDMSLELYHLRDIVPFSIPICDITFLSTSSYIDSGLAGRPNQRRGYAGILDATHAVREMGGETDGRDDGD